jgi:hypothetical protein
MLSITDDLTNRANLAFIEDFLGALVYLSPMVGVGPDVVE